MILLQTECGVQCIASDGQNVLPAPRCRAGRAVFGAGARSEHLNFGWGGYLCVFHSGNMGEKPAECPVNTGYFRG